MLNTFYNAKYMLQCVTLAMLNTFQNAKYNLQCKITLTMLISFTTQNSF